MTDDRSYTFFNKLGVKNARIDFKFIDILYQPMLHDTGHET